MTPISTCQVSTFVGRAMAADGVEPGASFAVLRVDANEASSARPPVTGVPSPRHFPLFATLRTLVSNGHVRLQELGLGCGRADATADDEMAFAPARLLAPPGSCTARSRRGRPLANRHDIGAASRAAFGAAPRSPVQLCTGRADPAA